MSTDFDKLREIFLTAVEQYAPDLRDAYLDQACEGDEELRRNVTVLLEAHDGGKGPLERGALPRDHIGASCPPTEVPGTLIGPYRLLEQIGEGGMGTVFRAEQTQPVQRNVALKILKPGLDSR